MGQGDPGGGGGTKGRRDPRHHLKGDAGVLEGEGFLSPATEHEGVPPLEAHYHLMPMGQLDEEPVHRFLGARSHPGPSSHGEALGSRWNEAKEFRVHQSVKGYRSRQAKQFGTPKGQEPRVTGSGPYQIDRSHSFPRHSLLPFHRGTNPVMRSPPGLLLLGHGSHLSPHSSRPVRDLALALSGHSAFGEVRAAFWKEDLHLHEALATMESPEVLVIPVFTSTGYFVSQVVPRELGLMGSEGLGAPSGVRLLDPVGVHPTMGDIILHRAEEARRGAFETIASRPSGGEDGKDDVALLLVGHGTHRHPESGRTTREWVERLASRWPWGPMAFAFLDEDPGVTEVVERLPTSRVVVVPFFISEGWHAGTTLPGSLGLEGGGGEVGGKELRYTRAVGTHPEMTSLLLSMARTAGETPSDRPLPNGVQGEGAVSHRPAPAARAAFLTWLAEGGEDGRSFLQLRIRPHHDARYLLHHRADEGADPTELRLLRTPAEWEAVIARAEGGAHRPIRTAADLRRGWRTLPLTPHELWEALTHFYPGAAVQWHLRRTKNRPPSTFHEAVSRQTGIFESLPELNDARIDVAVRECCRGLPCLRHPEWHSHSTGFVREGADPGIPCLEPCSLLLSRAAHARTSSEDGSSSA